MRRIRKNPSFEVGMKVRIVSRSRGEIEGKVHMRLPDGMYVIAFPDLGTQRVPGKYLSEVA